MRARVIIYNPKLDSILLIHREKNGRNYWVIPGGGAKGKETPAQTAIREIREELELHFAAQDLSSIFEIEEADDKQVIFFTKTNIDYTPSISGEELDRSSKDNVYLPSWVKLSELATINLLPVEAKIKLQKYLNKMK